MLYYKSNNKTKTIINELFNMDNVNLSKYSNTSKDIFEFYSIDSEKNKIIISDDYILRIIQEDLPSNDKLKILRFLYKCKFMLSTEALNKLITEINLILYKKNSKKNRYQNNLNNIRYKFNIQINNFNRNILTGITFENTQVNDIINIDYETNKITISDDYIRIMDEYENICKSFYQSLFSELIEQGDTYYL